jgi:hypothetical protein
MPQRRSVPYRLAIRGTIGPFEGTLTYELEPSGGGTYVTNTAHLQATGLERLVASIATKRISPTGLPVGCGCEL